MFFSTLAARVNRGVGSLRVLGSAFLIAALPLVAMPQVAFGANVTWITTGTNLWSTGGNWSNGTGPADSTTTDTAQFSSVNGTSLVQLNNNRAIAGMTFTNTGSSSIASDSGTTRTLTVGASGITVNSGAGTVTIGDVAAPLSVVLSGSQVWSNNSGNALILVSSATSSSRFTKSGAGRLVVQQAFSNSLVGSLTAGNGPFSITAGTLEVASGGSLNATAADGTVGSAQGALRVATAAGQTATLSVTGGAISVPRLFMGYNIAASTPTFTMDSGTVTTSAEFVGAYNSVSGTTLSTITIGGGALNANTFFTLGASGSNGRTITTLTQTGGTVSTTGSNGTMYSSLGSGVTATYNLNGGVLVTAGLTNPGNAAAANQTFTFGGGTLRASRDNATFIVSSIGNVNIKDAGAFIDTQGFGVTIDNPITNFSGHTGGLTKIGTGTLTLSGSNSFSGGMAVRDGVVRFNSVAASTAAQALGSGSAVNLGVAATSSGEIDYFGATSGTFDKNVFALGNGRNRIRNSSAGQLTLSGTLTKNGTILELAGGTFTVSGQITGTSANSDLYVNGANVTLSNANNDYNGPTYVYGGGVLALGTNNVIPAGSVVTLGGTGGGDTGTGTLSVGSFSDALGGLKFGSAGGTLRITASATGATAQLTAATGTMALAGGTLDLTGSGTTAGLYRLLSAQSITGAFSGTTGLSDAYQLLTTGSTVNLQQRAVLGTVSVTNPTVSIITGGSAAFTYTVANAALSGGASLTFTGTGFSKIAGSSFGSADAAGTSSSISGLFFTGTSIGSNQQGTFTVSAPSAYGTTSGTGTVSVNVLDHALPGFVAAGITNAYTQPTLNINFGSIDQSAGMQSFTYSLTNLASQIYGADLTASLDFLSVTADGNGFASGLSTFNGLLAGGTSSQFTFTFTPGGQGSFNKTFTLQFSDNRNLSGAAATRDLTISAQVIVVPEPGTLALAGIGVAAGGWVAYKRRRSP